jgi:cytochrome P450
MPGEPKAHFNPFDPAFRSNPYPHYAALRAGLPRRMEFFMPIVMIARYADVVAVMQDHERFSADRTKALLVNEGYDNVQNMLTALLSDPPVHTRIRRASRRSITATLFSAWTEEPAAGNLTAGVSAWNRRERAARSVGVASSESRRIEISGAVGLASRLP